MIPLTADELRVLGVLIEKELTVPSQYPLTLNSLIDGCNQKNNRDPVANFIEDQALDAIDGLKAKGLVMQVYLANSRVPKYRHQAPEKLKLSRYELVVLAELMLRGPQTIGELRGRASRMHPLENLEVVKEVLAGMAGRPEPLTKELPPSPGVRAERYMQLLCPEAHPIDTPAGAPVVQGASTKSLTMRVEALESQVAALQGALRMLATALGEPDPLPPASAPTPDAQES